MVKELGEYLTFQFLSPDDTEDNTSSLYVIVESSMFCFYPIV